jgi:hypothetical protein
VDESAGSARATTAPRQNASKARARTIYLPDDLFERIIVQAHRRDCTISEYVAALLDRQVPDHRVMRVESAALTEMEGDTGL